MADIGFKATLREFPEVTADEIRGLTVSEIRQLALARRFAKPRDKQSTKRLIADDVKRRVAAGEHWDSIVDLSETMKNEVRGLRHLRPRTIENNLRNWTLWPLPANK